jgi:hypothetical protein
VPRQTQSVSSPLQGVSLHLQTKHAVGITWPRTTFCHLTLVVATRSRTTRRRPWRRRRFRAAIEGGQRHADDHEGTELQFSCAPGATAMTVVPLRQVAYSTPQR